ncbi:ATP-dependent DNA ligase [Streptomyces sp. NPDC012508]|uniref:ATP-dependent DNA ligase n=1 Tax=Streptomyces sp. NPDC012508 TaxID=3364837 RepID=UPI0036CF84A5
MVLTPPFEPMLAQAAEYLPGSGVLASGFAAEQKFDGHRAILFTPTGPGGRLLLQTRRGSLIQDRLPDMVAAAEQLPDGLVLDGELIVWDTEAGRLSFESLQRRAAARGRTATVLAAKSPAFFIAFDALQIDGTELLALAYAERRRRLEVLFAARALNAPWTLCPMTTDPDKAREWLEDWTDVTGITGTLTHPQLLILGRHDPTGRLRPIGRTVPLRPDAARQLAEHLTPAGTGHPWTGARFSSAWGTRDVLEATLTQPESRRGDQHRHLSRPRRPPAPDQVRAPAPGCIHRGRAPARRGCLHLLTSSCTISGVTPKGAGRSGDHCA